MMTEKIVKILKVEWLIVLGVLVFISNVDLFAAQSPICIPPPVDIVECSPPCDDSYIPKFQSSSSLTNSPLYVNPLTKYIGMFTTSPTAHFEIVSNNPNINLKWPGFFQVNLKVVTDNFNNKPAFQAINITDNDQPLFTIVNDGVWNKVRLGSLTEYWKLLQPTSSPPISCDSSREGAIYWQQGEGLCCCYSQGWRKCSNSQQPCVSVPTYTLTVNKAGSGSGTVTGTGIDCGSDCSESFQQGAQVTLTATAASGSTFAGWQGCDSTNGNQCTVTMNSNKTVTATFNTTGGGGGNQPTGDLKVNGSDGPVSVTAGQSVTVSWSGIQNCDYATWEQRSGGSIIEGPNSASIPSGSAGSTVQDNVTSYTLTCRQPVLEQIDEVSVNLTQQSYTLTVNKSGNGTVTSNPGGINCGGDCQENYQSDTQVTITARPGGSKIGTVIEGDCGQNIGGGGQSIQVTCTMNSNKTVNVDFIQLPDSCNNDGDCPVPFRCRNRACAP
ncbi:MAG: hypothetical protein QXO57_04030 [Candidatus Aenigmatarchaeota archaeon]